MILKNGILLNQFVKQVNGNLVSDMGGEKVMLSINKGKYYNLGEIGGEIWDLLEDGIVVQHLVEDLQSKYNIDKSQCQDQVIAFLEQLYQEDLIVVSQ